MTELEQIILAGLIGFIIGFLVKKSRSEKEIKNHNSEVKALMIEMRTDLTESRIERDGVLINQDLILENLQTYEKHYSDMIKEEQKKKPNNKNENSVNEQLEDIKSRHNQND